MSRVSFGSLAHVIAITLVACGGSTPTPPPVDAAAPDAPAGSTPDADPTLPDADPSAPDGGAMGVECGGTNPPCPSGDFCDWPDDTCGFDDGTGVCEPMPTEGCPRIYAPMCGCDRVTYDNECFANAAGQDVLYIGPCPTAQCGGFTGMVCAADEYCDWTPDSCGNADQIGDCRRRPDFCPDVVLPVCACDGMTYGNECEANAAGQDIIHEGRCT
jgi:hypothetical protein